MWSPVSSADETIAPVIFVMGMLLHLVCLFWGQMLCLAALPWEKSKGMGWRCISFRDQVCLGFFTSLFPQKEQRCWRASPRNRDCSFVVYRESHPAPASDPHPNLSSVPHLSLCQVMSNTCSHAEEGEKENNSNESQWTNQSFHTAWKNPGRDCHYFSLQAGDRREGEDQVREKVQKMGGKSWRRKGFALCGPCK